MKLQNILINSLCCEDTYNKIRQLDEDKILEEIIPEVKDMKLVGECKYHVVNAYEHSLKALKELETIIKEKGFFPTHIRKQIQDYLSSDLCSNLNRFQLLKLGVFLHDIGKPDSKTIDMAGRTHFKEHEIVGAEIAFNLGKNLSLKTDTIDLLTKYVRYHMILLVLYKTNNMSQEKLFEIFDIIGEDTIGILLLGYCDIVATRKLLHPNEDTGVIKTYMEYVLTNYIYRYK
ncbi:HDIG domain-containing metalloprotein [Romboutsia sp.]|uniref:HDIG domain-containing metalloprotein n=1 Tax=Romboutsia sp. TaxID=1965302 RepID=UPI002CF3385F|nr:HDIG domain-containing metalloprotein [Romboutsia sp.]HSQ89862.1 HDIG domain-containing protein [Romboutsia sp.]